MSSFEKPLPAGFVSSEGACVVPSKVSGAVSPPIAGLTGKPEAPVPTLNGAAVSSAVTPG